MGSNYYPWGPHGERVSPFEVKPNPTPSTPAPQFESPSFPQPTAPSNAYGGYSARGYSAANAGGYTGTGSSGGIERVGGFFVSLVVVGFLWQFWICLYPLTAIATGLTTVYSAGFLVKYFPPDPVLRTNNFLALLIACAAGIAVLVAASRIEQRLARHDWYRIPRHAVRLALFALLAVFSIERANGLAIFGPGDFEISTANIMRVLRVPEYLVAVLVFVVVMHFVLWKAEPVRAFWHRRLQALGLRNA